MSVSRNEGRSGDGGNIGKPSTPSPKRSAPGPAKADEPEGTNERNHLT